MRPGSFTPLHLEDRVVGVRLIDLAEGERVVGVARLAEKEEEDEGNKEGEEGNIILLTDPIDEE